MEKPQVKVLYELSKEGQKASFLAGRTGQVLQVLHISHGDQLYELAVGLACINRDGSAVIDTTFFDGNKEWGYYPSTEEVLTREKNRQEQLIEEKAAFEARLAAEKEVIVQRCLKQGPEAFITTESFGTTFCEVTDDERLVSLKQEAKKIVKERRAQEKAKADVQVKNTKLKAKQEEFCRLAWIENHGSFRLKRMIEEDIEHQATYRDERLKNDYPGWSWAKNLEGEYDEPRNPLEEAFVILDEARKKAPKAKLVYWTVCEEDITLPAWRKQYVVVAEFLGQEIVYGHNRKSGRTLG